MLVGICIPLYNKSNVMKNILTKEEATEILLRPLFINGDIQKRMMKSIGNYKDYKFIRIFRKSTNLMLCKFSPNKFYIKYN